MYELLAELSFTDMLPYAAFGLIAALAWLGLEYMARNKTRSEERLDEIRDPAARRRKDKDGRSGSGAGEAMTRVLEKATPMLAKPLTPRSEKEANLLKQRLQHAGFRAEGVQGIFLGMKFGGLLVGLFLGGGWMALSGMSQWALIRLVGFGGGLFYLPDLVLWFLGRRRKQAIFLGLPDALDLLVVCVEAGLGLDQAMRKVAEEMKKSHRTIAEEFALCNMQLQMGRARNEVLRELGERSGVEDLKSLASILIQADKFGSSIAQALRVQSDAMRTRRRQIAEEKAAKTAVQLIFPLVLFIFPGIFVVLVGPAAITMINQMLPAMQR